MKYTTLIVLALLVWGCNIGDDVSSPEIVFTGSYFPSINDSTWQTMRPDSLNWDTQFIQELYDFLSENNTRAFLILKDGKIVVEKYWGRNILNTSAFDEETKWYWASAGKTITAFLVGKAQEEGRLNIEDKTSDYLGEGWTNLPLDKENLITVRNQLTMTTGLDYQVQDWTCTLPSCLQFKTDAGEQWYYHNAPYTLLESVVSNATNEDYNTYTDEKLETHIGMQGEWRDSGYNKLYWSRARDAARFGLLILNKGKWKGETILADMDYYNAMVNSSQELNPSYGYLWWLNGKDKIIYPGLPTSFNTSLSLNAPTDLFAAMGKNGQFIDIIPSENMVVIRMGELPNNGLVPVKFHDEMWEKINAFLQ